MYTCLLRTTNKFDGSSGYYSNGRPREGQWVGDPAVQFRALEYDKPSHTNFRTLQLSRWDS
jgi:hypothetical protein